MYGVQLGPPTSPAQRRTRRAEAIARRVARFASPRPRHEAASELKELSRRRPGAVRFTPPPQA